jgi:hypothetical protein
MYPSNPPFSLKLIPKCSAIANRKTLLVLDNAAADFEVGHDLEGVLDSGNASAGALDELAELGEQTFEAVRFGFGCGSGLL